MAEHVWSVLCYKGCIDQFTHQVSLLDVYEELTLSPVQPRTDSPPIGAAFRGQCDIVSLWWRSKPGTKERARMRVRLARPDGIIGPEDVPIEIDLETGERARTVLKIEALPFWGTGVYRFLVELEGPEPNVWHQCASIPLMIKLGAAPEAAIPAPASVKSRPKKKRSRR
jgi:hypothetical protein